MKLPYYKNHIGKGLVGFFGANAQRLTIVKTHINCFRESTQNKTVGDIEKITTAKSDSAL